MARLICRKCQSRGDVTSQSTYKYKKLVCVKCPNCGTTWVLSVPKDWKPEMEDMYKVITTDGEVKVERRKTNMEIAFEKAMKAAKK